MIEECEDDDEFVRVKLDHEGFEQHNPIVIKKSHIREDTSVRRRDS